ncbi:MAG TPA: DUF1217 domain-containing protein [Acetobacteraceae bacterium]|nr:DUF1217 domain-containing protein [Acetobacteraceae bacterium]
MLNGIGAPAAWAILQRQGEAMQARFAARRDNLAEAERFRARAAEIPTVDALLRDRRTLSMVLEAFQLEGEVDKRAVVRRLLTEDPADERSFANRMADPRYRQINAAFGGRDGAPLRDPRLVERLIQGALVNRFEKAMGEGNPGLREALYFRRMIGGVASVPALMADRALTTVVRGALGQPAQFGLLSYERQRDFLASRLDPSAFGDAKAMDRLIARYLARAGEGAAQAPADPRLALLGGAGGSGALLTLTI